MVELWSMTKASCCTGKRALCHCVRFARRHILSCTGMPCYSLHEADELI